MRLSIQALRITFDARVRPGRRVPCMRIRLSRHALKDSYAASLRIAHLMVLQRRKPRIIIESERAVAFFGIFPVPHEIVDDLYNTAAKTITFNRTPQGNTLLMSIEGTVVPQEVEKFREDFARIEQCEVHLLDSDESSLWSATVYEYLQTPPSDVATLWKEMFS